MTEVAAPRDIAVSGNPDFRSAPEDTAARKDSAESARYSGSRRPGIGMPVTLLPDARRGPAVRNHQRILGLGGTVEIPFEYRTSRSSTISDDAARRELRIGAAGEQHAGETGRGACKSSGGRT